VNVFPPDPLVRLATPCPTTSPHPAPIIAHAPPPQPTAAVFTPFPTSRLSVNMICVPAQLSSPPDSFAHVLVPLIGMLGGFGPVVLIVLTFSACQLLYSWPTPAVLLWFNSPDHFIWFLTCLQVFSSRSQHSACTCACPTHPKGSPTFLARVCPILRLESVRSRFRVF